MPSQEFTTTDTWTCPAGVTSVQVECWAGGAGSAVSSPWPDGGGGGGAYSKTVGISVTPSSEYNVIVGTGGGCAVGGGDSYFDDGSEVKAKGGVPGIGNNGGAGGAAVSGIGDTKYSGGKGGGIGTGYVGGGGGGGAGDSADGGAGGVPTGGTGGSAGGGAGGDGGEMVVVGNPGNICGGGGGGGGYGAVGAAGARGKVILTWEVAVAPEKATQYLSGHDCPEFPHEMDLMSDKLPCPPPYD